MLSVVCKENHSTENINITTVRGDRKGRRLLLIQIILVITNNN